MYTHYSLRIKAGEFEISLGFKEAFLKHFYKVFFDSGWVAHQAKAHGQKLTTICPQKNAHETKAHKTL